MMEDKAVYAIACSLLLLGSVSPVAAADRVPLRHELRLRLDPAGRMISGVDRIQPGPLPAAEFVLAPSLRVRRLLVDGKAVPVRRDQGRWRFEAPAEPPSELLVEYEGTIAPSADGDTGEALVGLSGTFLANDGWFPDFGDVLLSYDLIVSVPPGQVAVAPGRLAREENSSEGYTARFVSEGPTDEIAVFAGPYRISEKHHGRLILRTYLHPEVNDLAPLYLAKIGSYIDLYTQWIGKYPFSSFRVVSSPLPVGLGFPGLTYVGTQVLRLPFLPETSLGHEILHCWWGNGVLIDLSEGNWAEGLTTFMADYTYAERKGEDAARDMRLRWLREYAVLPEDRDLRLSEFRGRHHTVSQVVGYHRAAMLFLMLRDEIGMERFNAGVRGFWSTNRFRAARWRDLRRSFEKAAGRSLEVFLSQWLERGGAPVLRLGKPVVRKSDGAWDVTFSLEQEKPDYRLHVPVKVTTASGVVATSVDIDSSSQAFAVRVDSRPEVLAIDPDFRLFRRLDPSEVPPILRGVAFDDRAPVVVADRGSRAREVAGEVAASFFERKARVVDASVAFPRGSVLVVGTTGAVEALLAREGLPLPPQRVGDHGTARAWAAKRNARDTLGVVSAKDLSALRAIARPLPHYGSESFVIFEGRTVTDRGLLPAGAGPLQVDLDREHR